MDARIKAEINQIEEMISIYRNSIDITDSETLILMKADLENKKKRLEEIREDFNSELSSLYDNGADEIEVLPIKNEIQKIDNSLEIIEELTHANTFAVEEQEVNSENEIEENVDIQPIEEIPDLEEELDDESIFYEQEDSEILEESETDEFLSDLEDELEYSVEILEEKSMLGSEEQTFESSIPEFEEVSEPIKNEEDYSNLEESEYFSQDSSYEETYITFVNKDNSVEFDYMNKQENYENYENLAKQIIDSRKQSVKTPEHAISKVLKAKNMLIENIESLDSQLEEQKDTEKKIADFEKDERQL